MHGDKVGDVRVLPFVGASSLEQFLSHGGNRVLGDRVIGPISCTDDDEGTQVKIEVPQAAKHHFFTISLFLIPKQSKVSSVFLVCF